jgi:RNA polymerase sigma factor (sigma-70 family)
VDPQHDLVELVAAAGRGDQGAWDAIVERFLPLVFSITRAHRLNERDAEDVNQTVWLRLVEHLDQIREPLALPKWIATTTRRESLRVIRGRNRELSVDPLADFQLEGSGDVELDSEILRAERNQALRDGLAELSPDQRRFLLLLVADPPLSYREISRLLGIPIGSIGPTRGRLLERLRGSAALQAFTSAAPLTEDVR